MDSWAPDPSLDWPSRFPVGTVVRLLDGRSVGVVDYVNNRSADQARPVYDLVVTYLHPAGHRDTIVIPPWACLPAADEQALVEAADAGLR